MFINQFDAKMLYKFHVHVRETIRNACRPTQVIIVYCCGEIVYYAFVWLCQKVVCWKIEVCEQHESFGYR